MYYLLFVGRSLLFVVCCLLSVCFVFVFFVVHCCLSWFVVSRVMLVACFFVVRSWLVAVVCCLLGRLSLLGLFIRCCLLFVVCCLLFVVVCYLLSLVCHMLVLACCVLLVVLSVLRQLLGVRCLLFVG